MTTIQNVNHTPSITCVGLTELDITPSQHFVVRYHIFDICMKELLCIGTYNILYEVRALKIRLHNFYHTPTQEYTRNSKNKIVTQ